MGAPFCVADLATGLGRAVSFGGGLLAWLGATRVRAGEESDSNSGVGVRFRFVALRPCCVPTRVR